MKKKKNEKNEDFSLSRCFLDLNAVCFSRELAIQSEVALYFILVHIYKHSNIYLMRINELEFYMSLLLTLFFYG